MLAKMDPAAASAPPPSKSGDVVDTHHTLDMAYRCGLTQEQLTRDVVVCLCRRVIERVLLRVLSFLTWIFVRVVVV